MTGTAFGWKSISNGTKSTFGVSGLLYNSNLILYDRNSDSLWSQLELKCVNGKQIGDEPTLVNVIESAGIKRVEWNANNYASGIYIIRISAKSLHTNNNFNSIKKMILLK